MTYLIFYTWESTQNGCVCGVGVWVCEWGGWYLTSKPCKSSQIRSLLAQRLHWYIPAWSISVTPYLAFCSCAMIRSTFYFISGNGKFLDQEYRIWNKRPMGHIAHLKNQFKSINTCAKLRNISWHWLREQIISF